MLIDLLFQIVIAMEPSRLGTATKRRTREQMKELKNEFEQTDLTVHSFSRLHNISTAILYRWKNAYQNGGGKSSGFARVTITPSQHGAQGLFAEVGGIRIYQPVSASFLKELL